MDIITSKKVKLIKWLREDGYILQHAQSKKLISMDEYTKLKSIPDPGTQITDLLDLMLQKGQRVCVDFLDMLKDDDVNESSPELREWIKSVNTSGKSEMKPDAQPATQSPGNSVAIAAKEASNVCSPVVIGSISSLVMNTNQSAKCSDEKPLMSNDRTQNNDPRKKDNQEFLKTHRGELIDKVKNVDRIIDDLSLSGEMAANVRAEKTEQAKMRTLLDYTNSKAAARRLVDALNKHAADVMEDLDQP